MIDYSTVSDGKINTIIENPENYADVNVIVALCEARRRELPIETRLFDNFCERNNAKDIADVTASFLSARGYATYNDYVRDVQWQKKLEKKDTTPPLRKTENVVNKIGQLQNSENRVPTETSHITRSILYLVSGIAIYYFLQTYIQTSAELGEGVPKIFKLVLAQIAVIGIFGILTLIHFIRALVKWKRC